MDAERLIVESIVVPQASGLPRFCVARFGSADYDGLASYLCSPSGVSASCRCVHAPRGESPGVIAYGREVRLYDAEGHPTRVARLGDRITAAAYSERTGLLVIALATGSVWAWNVVEGTEHRLEGVAGATCVAVRPDGAVCACGAGTTVTLHDLETLERIHELTGMQESVGSVNFADEGRVVVAAGATSYFTHDDDDSDVVAWDASTGAMLWHRFIDRGDTASIWIASDDRRVAGGGLREPSFVLDVRTGENASGDGLAAPDALLPVVARPGARPVSSLDVSADGRWLVTNEVLWSVADGTSYLLPPTKSLTDQVGFLSGADACLRMYLGGDVEHLAIPSLEPQGRSEYAKGFWRDALLPGGEWIVTVFQDFNCNGGPETNRIVLFGASDLRPVVTIAHPLVELAGLEASSSGDALVGIAGGEAIVWSVPSGERQGSCRVRGGCYAAGPRGTLIAVAAPLEPMMEVVDTGTGEVVERVETPGSVPANAAFSPDGALLAVADVDWTIRLRRLGGGGEAVLRGHLDGVTRLVFSRDGRTLYTGSRDFVVLAWDVEAALSEAS